MGPRRQVKGTYSRCPKATTEEDRRKLYKRRRVIPHFDDLFLQNDENENASTCDPFDCLNGDKKPSSNLEQSSAAVDSKSFRKPLGVNSFLTNSTFGSVEHSSANDTFDKLIVKNRRLPRKSKADCGVLSSTSSSIDATDFLYHSLRSQSNLNVGIGERSKFNLIKEEKSPIRKSKESDNQDETTASPQNGQTSPLREMKNEPLSPQLFTSSDENPSKDGENIHKVKSTPVSPQMFSSYDDKSDYKSNAPLSTVGQIKVIKKDRKVSQSSSKSSSDSLKPKLFDCNGDVKGAQTLSESPSRDVESASNAGGVSPNETPITNLPEKLCTPGYSNKVAKLFLNPKSASSQIKCPALQLSRLSQDSGKSSVKSALTSTPLDSSRIKSLSDNSFGLWRSTNEEMISPVPREGRVSVSVFESPLSNCLRKISLSDSKSKNSPSFGSQYHTCVSENCKSSDCGKRSKHNSVEIETHKLCDNIVSGEEALKAEKSSALVLQNLPLKTLVIPSVDIAHKISPKDDSPLTGNIDSIPYEQCQSPSHSSSPKSIANNSIGMVETKSSINKVTCDGLNDTSRNSSIKKKRQFPNPPSFCISLRSKQRRKFLINKVNPTPVVKRLTRQSSRISSLKKKEIPNSCRRDTSWTSHSTEGSFNGSTEEVSYVLPRRIKQKSLAHSRKKQNEHMNSPINSALLPRKSLVKDVSSSSFVKPSPVLGRRTSVRLALKRHDLNHTKNSVSSTDDSLSFRFKERVFVATRAHTKKLTNRRKQLSIMQFSFSSVKSDNYDLEESKNSISSKTKQSDCESVSSVSNRKPSLGYEISLSSEFAKSSIASSYLSDNEHLESQVIEEEPEDTVISNDNDNTTMSTDRHCQSGKVSIISENSLLPDTSEHLVSVERLSCIPKDENCQVDCSSILPQYSSQDTVSLKDGAMSDRSAVLPLQLQNSFMNDTNVPEFDVNLEDNVFSLPFQAPLPIKRGKGWIRSLSIARASLLGSEKSKEGVRRQTVHRMSVGGRRTLLNISIVPETSVHDDVSLGDNDECQQQLCPLNQSVIDDPKRHVLALCSQTVPVPINECFTESRLSCCKKIGEGVYGEVFMTKPNPSNMDDATVLKIMPIEGKFDVNGEPQKQFHEILSEIIISMELSNLQKNREGNNWTRNFVHVLNCWCVEGSYHHDMLQLWDEFHEEKGSENDRPDIFPDTQLYIVLEFSHGGRDLEGFVFNNAGQSLSVFLQIAYSLAVAEQELEFEHRDLHWGNVLVATTSEAKVDFVINGGTYTIATQGVMATVIDFTLSRLKAPHCVMFNNLAEDPSLFTAEGDYQFEIYREMKRVNRNNWQNFTPYTNVLWLHYILDKMISECYYKNVKTRVHRTNLHQLNKLKNEILDCESATAFLFKREHFGS